MYKPGMGVCADGGETPGTSANSQIPVDGQERDSVHLDAAVGKLLEGEYQF